VAHTCNPSYSGGSDQDDHGSKPAQKNSSARPYFEKSITKIRLGEWLKAKAQSSNSSTTHTQKSLILLYLFPQILFYSLTNLLGYFV
jgi:hypothetical protein